jgi:hypothetical protein
MTNEPGIYIREDALSYLADTAENQAFIAKVKPAFERYKNIGIRIEDDMLVTETGTEWMTKKLPRSITDIEAFMAKASKEVIFTARRRPITASGLALFANTGNIILPEGPFTVFNLTPQGKTERKGWIWSGRQTARAGSNHAGHSHAE